MWNPSQSFKQLTVWAMCSLLHNYSALLVLRPADTANHPTTVIACLRMNDYKNLSELDIIIITFTSRIATRISCPQTVTVPSLKGKYASLLGSWGCLLALCMHNERWRLDVQLFSEFLQVLIPAALVENTQRAACATAVPQSPRSERRHQLLHTTAAQTNRRVSI